jgi:hypothetical protein
MVRTRTRRFAPTLPDFTPPDDLLDLPPELLADRDDEAEQTPVHEAARLRREQAGDELPYQHPGEIDLDAMFLHHRLETKRRAANRWWMRVAARPARLTRRQIARLARAVAAGAHS